jgi:hypothetical protein
MGSKKKQRKAKKHETPGPKPEILKIDGNWKAAIKRSLEKKRPAEGWPKSA